jgi:hypothetical protein
MGTKGMSLRKTEHQLEVYEREARKMSKAALESHYSCALANWNIALDEMDRLHAKLERLQKKLKKRRRGRSLRRSGRRE